MITPYLGQLQHASTMFKNSLRQRKDIGFRRFVRPSHALLEAACKVAAREPSKEVDAMFDCFLQLRVEPPADFPISDEKRKHREERLKAREERSQRWKEKQSQEGEAPAIEDWNRENLLNV